VAAAAVASAVVLATPSDWRGVSVIVGSVYALWMTVAVVAIGWHYPTDAFAGLALGVGVVILADGLLRRTADALAALRATRRARARPG
jgi:membrane-associated phospholipid phosphatase